MEKNKINELVCHFKKQGYENEWIELYLIKKYNDNDLVHEVIQRVSQAEFRKSIIERDHVCIISGSEPIECEAAHIILIPLCKNYDLSNGFLLNLCLHKLFDEHLFSINPKTNKIVIKKNIVNLSICKYKNKIINLPPECKVSLTHHYDAFLSKNKQN